MAKQPKKTGTAIMKFEPTEALAVLPTINSAFTRLAEILSLETLPPATLAATMKVLRDAKKGIDGGLEPIAKKKIIALLKDLPPKVGTKGSREMVVEGWRIPMKPYRTGTDPKKLEALIRAKGLEPGKFMSTKITYELSDDDVKKAALAKVVSGDEIESCKYEESWTVETPEPV